ncbi:hypothetical protein FA95DRAFT_1347191 [Auriscalpium vulgare]|uniref:Uncharacterized protein n=1 Tax=Auriscalpium vulgare TaxID=40419 RepID=A0ACB8RSV9_9AGAM|nr:hypothetical protein FA95DRAFT_1347191 [Auriscalpium vulgare]
MEAEGASTRSESPSGVKGTGTGDIGAPGCARDRGTTGCPVCARERFAGSAVPVKLLSHESLHVIRCWRTKGDTTRTTLHVHLHPAAASSAVRRSTLAQGAKARRAGVPPCCRRAWYSKRRSSRGIGANARTASGMSRMRMPRRTASCRCRCQMKRNPWRTRCKLNAGR